MAVLSLQPDKVHPSQQDSEAKDPGHLQQQAHQAEGVYAEGPGDLQLDNNGLSKLDLSGLMKLTNAGLDNNRLPSVESLKLSVMPQNLSFGPQRIR